MNKQQSIPLIKSILLIHEHVCGRLNEISARNSEIYGYTSQVSKIRTIRQYDSLIYIFQFSFMTFILQISEWSFLTCVEV